MRRFGDSLVNVEKWAAIIVASGVVTLAACSSSNDGTTAATEDAGATSSSTSSGASGSTSSSSSTSGGPSNTSSSSTSSSTSSGSSGAMTCNTLTQQGVPVTANVVGEASPNTPQGGELVPGTYTFTAQTFYVPGAQPNTTTLPAQTVEISAGSSQWLMKDQDGTDIRFTAKLTMNGTAFTRNITCSSPSTADPFSYKYSATPTTFTMFSDLGGGSVEQTFTLK